MHAMALKHSPRSVWCHPHRVQLEFMSILMPALPSMLPAAVGRICLCRLPACLPPPAPARGQPTWHCMGLLDHTSPAAASVPLVVMLGVAEAGAWAPCLH